MKKLAFVFVIILSSLFVFTSCDNSINLAADYKETTVVYAIFDPSDSISYIRVTKAFLGNGSIIEMAKERDSSEYKNISVTLEKYINKKLVKTFDFEPVELDGKQDGIFYSPRHTVYAAVTYNELDCTNTRDTIYSYEVKVKNNSKEIVGRNMTLVGGEFIGTTPMPGHDGKPGTISFLNNKISKTPIAWSAVENGHIYSLDAEFYFLEVFTNGDSIQRTVKWDSIVSVSSGDANVKVEIQCTKFFDMVLAQVPYKNSEKENSVVKRRIGSDVLGDMTFFFKVGTKDFYEYITIRQLSSGMNQDIPIYTNVDNGIGLITSRITHSRVFVMTDHAKNALLEDSDFDHLKFKSFQ